MSIKTEPNRQDELVAQCREMVQEVQAHEHPTREDFYCLNHVAYMGERMNFILSHIDALDAEVERLRVALQAVADTPDPMRGGCHCRWSQGVARQALDALVRHKSR